MFYKNYIGGAWVESTSGKTFESRNPAHCGQVVGEFQDSTVTVSYTHLTLPTKRIV